MPVAYVGLGANLGVREASIVEAGRLLSAHPDVTVVATATLRETEPWGPVPQPSYLNTALALETELSPNALLEVLLGIERQLGRERTGEERYGPRVIDLDLLLYDSVVLDVPGLELPHPRLHERAFALEPLFELAPDLVVPGRGRVDELLAGLHSRT
jgi:2-amino-4-hydroxy-6-hydroxymethyldihydropteridine diphosphokinase